MDYSTIRKWLDQSGFRWDKGKIIIQECGIGRFPGWGTPVSARIASKDDHVLNIEFYSGHGGPECPRFVAEDDVAIYFPAQYDGATNIEKIWKGLDEYLTLSEPTPYPGG